MTATARAERILVVGPYAPRRDGIGALAVQQVKRLRSEAHDVEVCAPYPCAAHHHLPLTAPRGALALGRLLRGFDRAVVHFHPDVFYRHPATPSTRVAQGLALGASLRAGSAVELRLHEIDRRWADATDPSARATRWMLRGADRLTVYSTEQRDILVERFRVPARQVELVALGDDYVGRTQRDQASARASLGLPPDGHVFLCIGFVQPHKGFDRAIRAFAATSRSTRGKGTAPAQLHVVGSVRVDDQATADHVDELRGLAHDQDGVHLHLGFVSDEVFDRWIVAADTVVLPYRHIWSSGVAERARLFDRTVIATRVGGLADQLGSVPGAVLVDDDGALAVAMARAAGDDRDGPDRVPSPWPVDGGVDRASVQSEIRARAMTSRGGTTRPSTHAAIERRLTHGTATSTALRRLRPLSRPVPVSARPGVTPVKKLIRRLLAWEIDPIAEHLNRLQRATTEAVDTQPDPSPDDR